MRNLHTQFTKPQPSTVETSSIGPLIREAEDKAAGKASKTHTATAKCGCAVTASWFSPGGCLYRIEHCSEHPKPGQKARN